MPKTKPTEVQVKEALQHIIDNRHKNALNYAVNYAYYGLEMTGHELEVQCLYVLNNMTHWRGDLAKDVRATLKAFTK